MKVTYLQPLKNKYLHIRGLLVLIGLLGRASPHIRRVMRCLQHLPPDLVQGEGVGSAGDLQDGV